MICSNEERKNKTETYWIKYFCCRLESMKPLYKLLLQSLWKTDCNLAHTVFKKKPKQIKNPNKTTKKWIPDAIYAEEGHSEGQRLSVMLREVGKTLGCSLWQRKICMGLERLLSCWLELWVSAVQSEELRKWFPAMKPKGTALCE